MKPIIRLATERDAEQMLAIYAPLVQETSISFELTPPTVEVMKQRIVKTLQCKPWLCCEHKGKVLGYAYASEHRPRPAYQWSVNVSVYVDPEFHYRGVGRGIYTSLFRLLTLQGYYTAHAGITLPNPPSIRLHNSMGFQFVGVCQAVGFKLDKWHDVSWWQLPLKRKYSDPPTSPLKLESILQDSDSYQAALDAGTDLVRL